MAKPPLLEVLLVEKNEVEAAKCYSLFHENFPDCPVFIAQNSYRGLEFLTAKGPYSHRRNRDLPALALIGRHLTDRDGLWLLQEIASSPELKQIPVILLHEDKSSVSPNENFGQADLVKPLTLRKLGQAMEDLGVEDKFRPFNFRVQNLFRGQ